MLRSLFCGKNLKHFASRSRKSVDDHDFYWPEKALHFSLSSFFSFLFLLISATTYKAINYIQDNKKSLLDDN